ncbi:MAG: glycoside hydrolase family 18 protein [Chitinophagaceae bacterium]|nr:glycoside hydrolase family 18 protein [Chitinophagaceae bacterium]
MRRSLLVACWLLGVTLANGQTTSYDLIGYYTGDSAMLRQYPVHKLTHLIFSFLHLKGAELAFDNEKSRTNLRGIVAFKKEHPQLKVMLSLGGWEGCYTCSPTFATAENREVFANSVLRILQETNTDGIDLDWEYPAIPGPPGHPFIPEDRDNFTDLVRRLRNKLGTRYELSFAAGGFTSFLEKSIDWPAVTPLVDRINLMTYDLISGYSKVTGHHTALYSRPTQQESTDNCVQWLLRNGVPANKLVIGGAFYYRVWKNAAPANNGLDQAGEHTAGVSYKNFQQQLTPAQGYLPYWDEQAKAMHYYNAQLKQFATGDDPKSVREKVAYMKKYKLGGIMFWELKEDAPVNGLLDVMHSATREAQ